MNISVVSIRGHRRYTALYRKVNVGSWEAKSFLTTSKYQRLFDANQSVGRQLAYLNAYTHNGNTRFSAIWNSFSSCAFAARHGLTRSQYQQEWEKRTGKGYQTRLVTGYEEGNRTRFAAFWRK